MKCIVPPFFFFNDKLSFSKGLYHQTDIPLASLPPFKMPLWKDLSLSSLTPPLTYSLTLFLLILPQADHTVWSPATVNALYHESNNTSALQDFYTHCTFLTRKPKIQLGRKRFIGYFNIYVSDLRYLKTEIQLILIHRDADAVLMWIILLNCRTINIYILCTLQTTDSTSVLYCTFKSTFFKKNVAAQRRK